MRRWSDPTGESRRISRYSKVVNGRGACELSTRGSSAVEARDHCPMMSNRTTLITLPAEADCLKRSKRHPNRREEVTCDTADRPVESLEHRSSWSYPESTLSHRPGINGRERCAPVVTRVVSQESEAPPNPRSSHRPAARRILIRLAQDPGRQLVQDRASRVCREPTAPDLPAAEHRSGRDPVPRDLST
jgi:hypothetical protein